MDIVSIRCLTIRLLISYVVEKGDQVTDFLTAKFGIVFVKFNSQEEMMKTTERLQELIFAQID